MVVLNVVSFSLVGEEIKEEYISYDFGRVKKGELLHHTFPIKNKYGRILKVKGVITSCECLKASIDNTVLDKNQEAVVSVEFDTTDYQGKVSQYILVYFKDKSVPVFRIEIKAFVTDKINRGGM